MSLLYNIRQAVKEASSEKMVLFGVIHESHVANLSRIPSFRSIEDRKVPLPVLGTLPMEVGSIDILRLLVSGRYDLEDNDTIIACVVPVRIVERYRPEFEERPARGLIEYIINYGVKVQSAPPR